MLERNREDVLDELPSVALIKERGRKAMDSHPAPAYRPFVLVRHDGLWSFYGPPS